MPKNKEIESVVHIWLSALTFQMQALLFTAMRSPDALPKHNAAKALVRYLRGEVLRPAGDWKGRNDNDFMWGEYEYFENYVAEFIANHDEYPHHFLMHLIHCSEVVGYKHPDKEKRLYWKYLYFEFCKALHTTPETEEEMDKRLNDFKK